MNEKLLTVKEVAGILRLSEEAVINAVEKGEIPAYKVGGRFLRFKKDQIDQLKMRLFNSKQVYSPHRDSAWAKRDLQQYPYTRSEKIRDFFYFNDFYIFSLLIVVILLMLIFKG